MNNIIRFKINNITQYNINNIIRRLTYKATELPGILGNRRVMAVLTLTAAMFRLTQKDAT